MSEHPADCTQFEKLLVDGAAADEMDRWRSHLEKCANCREQLTMHQMLVATFNEVPVAELSGVFESGLQSKISAAVEIRPLEGWRAAAMIGYALVAVTFMAWVFDKFPLPPIPVDAASPWTLAVALACVPLTLWMAIGLTRWLPARHAKSFTQLSLL